MRIVHDGRFPLNHAAIRSADHPDIAVGPGLTGDPVERIASIAGLLLQRMEGASGSIAAADILHHHVITTIDERAIA